jgi:hypothetical protein
LGQSVFTQPRPKADTYVRDKRTLRIPYGSGTPAAGSDNLCGRAEAIAQAFDMQTWHMLIRTTGLPPKDLARLRRVIAAFLEGYHR